MSRVIIISGTRTGLGKALVEHFVAQGDLVWGCSRKPIDWELEGYHHRELDVADERAVTRFVREVKRAEGKVDCIVNNAGAAALNAFLLTPASTFRKLLETNTLGSFVLMREGAKAMMSQKAGRIVNLTTVAVPLDLAGEAAYAASKAAVESLTRVAARELGSYGITVNAVGPSPVRTALLRTVPEEKLHELLAQQALNRFAEPADVCHAVDFFLRVESRMITGQTLYLGGVF